MCHVDNTIWRLKAVPHIENVGFPLGILEEVALFAALGKALALYADIRIDPQANLKAHVFELGNHSRWIGKHLFVPYQLRPASEALPVAIQVQHIAGDIVFAYEFGALYDLVCTIALEARRHPQTKRPFGRQDGKTGQRGIFCHDGFQVGARYHIVIKRRIGADDAEAAGIAGYHVEIYWLRTVHKDPIFARAHKEGHVLVRTLAPYAPTIIVPRLDALPSLIEIGKFFTEPIEMLIRLGDKTIVKRDPFAIDSAEAAWQHRQLHSHIGALVVDLRQQRLSIGSIEGYMKRVQIKLHSYDVISDDKLILGILQRHPGLHRREIARQPDALCVGVFILQQHTGNALGHDHHSNGNAAATARYAF